MKKVFLYVLTAMLLFSCTSFNNSEDSYFAYEMDKFYFNHLRSPRNAEDFLYLTYRCDSANNYEDLCSELANYGLKSSEKNNAKVVQIVECLMDSNNVNKVLSYEQYNEIRALVYEKIKEIGWFAGYWGAIHQYQPPFEEDDSCLYLVDKIDTVNHYCEKTEIVMQKYIDNYDEWSDDFQPFYAEEESKALRVGRARECNKPRLYRKLNDGTFVQITTANVPEDLDYNLVDALEAVGHHANANRSTHSTPHFLQYDKTAGFTYYVQKGNVPDAIGKNKRLIESLNAVLNATRTDRIRFICVMQ